jgi:hypothetical protein
MDSIELGLGLNEPEAQDLLEVERNRAKDHTVRLWFIYTALNFGNNSLTDVARANFDKAHTHFLTLFNVGGQSAAETDLRETIKDRFHNEYAAEVLAL